MANGSVVPCEYFQILSTKGEIASELPTGDEIISLLNDKQTVKECHLDEIFPRGLNHCVLVVKDEHGRVLATQPVDKRDEESVKAFLEPVQNLLRSRERKARMTI